MNMIVFTAIFGVAADFGKKIPSEVPFAIFVFTGLIVWKLFSNALSVGGMSLINSQNLLTKIYFPRLFVPTATVGSAMVDMALQFLVFVAVMIFYGFVPSWQIVFLPLLVVLTVVMSLGVAFLLSALTVTYRDFRFVIPDDDADLDVAQLRPGTGAREHSQQPQVAGAAGDEPDVFDRSRVPKMRDRLRPGDGLPAGVSRHFGGHGFGAVRAGNFLLPQDRKAVRGYRVRRQPSKRFSQGHCNEPYAENFRPLPIPPHFRRFGQRTK